MSRRRKRTLGSIPFVGVLFSMTLALFLLGVFSLMMLLTKNLTSKIQGQIEMQVFLDKNASLSEVLQVQKTLSNMEFVIKENGKAQIEHISKDVAAQSFMEEIGEDFMHYIGENPLSDVLLVKIAPSYQSPTSFKHIAQKMESLKHVSEVAYVEQLVESINKNLAKIGGALIGLSLLLFAAVGIIVYNAIRLALYSQRFLIRSMQLVGATSAFIKKPFILRMILYGLVAGVLASALTQGLVWLAQNEIEQLSLLHQQGQLYILYGVVITVGLLAGYLSTKNAMDKYLNMSLDELY